MPARPRLHLQRRPTCWPAPVREDLIRAAAGDAPQALEAWERCQDDPALDPEILPQVFANLSRHRSADVSLQPHYDAARQENRKRLENMEDILGHLHKEEIPAMLLGGVALTLVYYRDPGARRMGELRVLVPTCEAGRALQLLAAVGWRSTEGAGLGLTPSQRRHRHAIHLVDRAGESLHLQWHLLAQSRTGEADAGFWKHGWPAYLNQERSLVLSPTHQLLHLCAESVNGGPEWAIDALTVIRECRIDWEALLDLARQHDLVLPVADALAYLLHTFHAAIPRSLVWRLEGEPISRLARMEYLGMTQPEGRHGLLVSWVRAYRDYQRGASDLPALQRLTGFPAYLRQ